MERVKIIGTPINSNISKGVPLYKREILSYKDDRTGRLIKKVNVSDISNINKHFLDLSWLKQASKKYDISPDIGDMVVSPVPIVTSDIPNRNCQGFSLKSLLDFEPEHGCLRYKTFVGKPTFEEHFSEDLKAAKGVNLDSSITMIPEYNIAKILVLSAFDRTKDEKLANAILKGERDSYSMGATCTYFDCSICGGVLGPGVSRTCTCKGTNFENLASYGKVKKGKLHYILAADPVFYELSNVSDPADIDASSKPL